MKKIIGILYFIFLLLFTFFSYAFVDQNFSYLKNLYTNFYLSNRLMTTIFFILSVVVFFIFYSIFIYLAVKKKIDLKETFLLIGVTAVTLLFSYPAMLSYDIFNYIATGKVLFFYQENPYIVMPIEFVGDPVLAFTHAANKIALYGPTWLALTGIPYSISFGHFLVNLFMLKSLVIIFYLSSVFLIWKLSRNIVPVVLLALNPLVVIESLVSGHNDIAMIFLVLLSFFLLTKKNIFLGVLFFILSIFVKYTTIVLVPIFLFVIWKIIQKKQFSLTTIFYYCFLLMLVAFFLSPLREEIYPWYAIWFLPFSFLVPNKKLLLYISIAFSFGLMFRYVPFIFSGTHAGITPTVKSIVTFVPSCLILFYFLIKKKLGKT